MNAANPSFGILYYLLVFKNGKIVSKTFVFFFLFCVHRILLVEILEFLAIISIPSLGQITFSKVMTWS